MVKTQVCTWCFLTLSLSHTWVLPMVSVILVYEAQSSWSKGSSMVTTGNSAVKLLYTCYAIVSKKGGLSHRGIIIACEAFASGRPLLVERKYVFLCMFRYAYIHSLHARPIHLGISLSCISAVLYWVHMSMCVHVYVSPTSISSSPEMIMEGSALGFLKSRLYLPSW